VPEEAKDEVDSRSKGRRLFRSWNARWRRKGKNAPEETECRQACDGPEDGDLIVVGCEVRGGRKAEAEEGRWKGKEGCKVSLRRMGETM
jgi:hypothetical protein